VQKQEQDIESFALFLQVPKRARAQFVATVKEALAAARETTSRSAKEPPRLKWDTDRKADEDPATFAARAGYEHRGMIHDEDRALSVKLSNWLRTHDWPEGVRYIPTLPDWNEKQAAKLPELRANIGDQVREVERLRAVDRRVRNSKRKTRHGIPAI
jgi:hypothetical protein